MDPRTGDGLLVVVPTFEERDSIESVLDDLSRALPAAHALVIDDASKDGTPEIVSGIASRNDRVHLVHRPRKLGLGTAYVAGFGWALERGYAAVGQMDADRSHDPRDFARMLEAIARGADVVCGSRNVPGGGVVGWGLGRHVLSKGGSLYARAILGCPIHDMTTGFRVLTRSALLAIDPASVRSNGYAFQVELTWRAIERGLVVEEIPIVFVDRRVGRSKMSERIFAEAVLGVVRMRLDRARAVSRDTPAR